MKIFLTFASLIVAGLVLLAAQNPAPPPAPPSSQSEVNIAIQGDIGQPLHYAVPDFVALTPDAETVAAGKLIGEVLFNDLAFERELDLIPRDTYRTIPVAQTAADIPFARWSELNADGVVFGTVQRTGNTFHVEMRLFNVRTQQVALGKQYDGIRVANPRAGAHAIADDIHEQRGLRGVARTRLTFASDRDNERMTDTVEKRDSKNIYIADYDGANTVRITTTAGPAEHQSQLVARRPEPRVHHLRAHHAANHRVEPVSRYQGHDDGREEPGVSFRSSPRTAPRSPSCRIAAATGWIST